LPALSSEAKVMEGLLVAIRLFPQRSVLCKFFPSDAKLGRGFAGTTSPPGVLNAHETPETSGSAVEPDLRGAGRLCSGIDPVAANDGLIGG
jgi:hypothetical protein